MGGVINIDIVPSPRSHPRIHPLLKATGLAAALHCNGEPDLIDYRCKKCGVLEHPRGVTTETGK